MQATDGATAPQGMNGVRAGKLISKELLVGRDGTANNYSFQIGSSESEYAVPRHRHNFDQVRYNVRGQIKYGDKVFPAGWVVYFPEGAWYGPQVREVGSLTLTGQFGGANGVGYLSKVQQKQAHADLLKKGVFEKGVFTWTDDAGRRHNQDAFEAVFEQVTGKKLAYPTPRYDDIVLMNPETYAWLPVPGKPGVAEKVLGTFTERETRIAMLRLDAGVTFQAGDPQAPQIVFVTKGGLAHAGHTYGPESAFGLDPAESAPLTASGPTELLTIRMPRF